MVERRDIRLEPGLGAVPQSRRFVVAAAEELLPADLAGRDIVLDGLALAVSEFTTNAIRVSEHPIAVAVEVDGDVVRVAVSDSCPTRPAPRAAGPSDTNGRGLAIVATIARTWGVQGHGQGKTVWAEFALEHRVLAEFSG